MYTKNASQHLGLDVHSHEQLDFVDVFIDKDSKLFIDPLLIKCFTDFDIYAHRVNDRLNSFFNYFFSVYSNPANRSEKNTLLKHAQEINETKLGYGNGLNGKGSTCQGLVKLFSPLEDLFDNQINISSPIDVPLVLHGFAEDRFSDMITNIISDILIDFTYDQCQKYKIDTVQAIEPRYFWDDTQNQWKPVFGDRLYINDTPILLVPKWFVRPKYFYNTRDFFIQKIVKYLQNKTEIAHGYRPSITELNEQLLTEYGCIHAVIFDFLKNYPGLLESYQDDLGLKYDFTDFHLNDVTLDDLLYRSEQ